MGSEFIARSDDFGSTKAANQAILEAVRLGYITRNVSCMAPGPYIAEAADELRKYKNIALGMHATLTSEWDGIKWESLGGKIPFYKSAEELAKNCPSVEDIIKEYDLQLDYLTKLGLNIDYVDSHMFPEYHVEGLLEASAEWIFKKGLINAENYYSFPEIIMPERSDSFEEFESNVKHYFSSMKDREQYFYLTHPAMDIEEALLMYNEEIPKGAMRIERSFEQRIVCSMQMRDFLEENHLKPIKYTEAREVGPGGFRKIMNLGE